MKKTNLDRLLQRYISGEVTEEEKIKIEAWLDVKKTDAGTNLVLDEADEEKLFRKITSSIDNINEIKRFRPAHTKVRALFSNRWFQVAATVLLLLTVSYTVSYFINKTTVQQTIARQEIEKVILNDGTIAWLRKGSELVYHDKASGPRQAELRGSALFEVAKDAARPFIITCRTATVKVIGTSFNLTSADDGVQLQVLTGKVNLSSEADKNGIDLMPNEKASYNGNGPITKTTMASSEKLVIIRNTEYNMEFRNTTMESVVYRLEKKFNINMVLDDQHVNRCRITADFTDHSLETAMAMISELLDIDYTIENKTVTITGNGCK